ncbi:MAG: ATP-binding cassette domain-containing protein, partial [Actinomycetes bacterium]
VLDERVLDERVLDQPSGASKEIFVPPEKRDAGVLFQDLALFPHMSALANVAFALEAGGVPKREAERRALALLGSLAIGSVSGARPVSLSGGEAQRVALARALVREPRMLLLDEPLSSLDASTRSNTRATLREVLEGFNGVRIIVTHDLADVVALASRVLVLESGAITHHGSIQEVLANPSSDYVRHLVSQNPNI